MSKRDYYEVLGVSRDASPDDLKRSYRQLALKLHPDKNPGNKEAEEAFKECAEAYQILSSPETRQRYDQFGHAAFQQGGGFEGFGDFSAFAEDIFGDIFGAFFGTGNQRRGARRKSGRDLKYQLELTLEEVFSGVEKEIELQRPVSCEECSGSGAKKGTSPEQCRQCGGAGQIRVQQGFFTISRPCGTCRGQGATIKDPCSACSGSGQQVRSKRLKVKVPAGVDHGQTLKIRGEGETIAGGPPGDLYVEIHLIEHDTFRRQENEIFCEVPISYTTAVLGGDIAVPTLEGEFTLKVPAHTQSGTTFRLRAKGFVDMRSGRRGDQHVRAYIAVPPKISDREREILQELSQIEAKPTAVEGRNFFDRVREFFE